MPKPRLPGPSSRQGPVPRRSGCTQDEPGGHSRLDHVPDCDTSRKSRPGPGACPPRCPVAAIGDYRLPLPNSLSVGAGAARFRTCCNRRLKSTLRIEPRSPIHSVNTSRSRWLGSVQPNSRWRETLGETGMKRQLRVWCGKGEGKLARLQARISDRDLVGGELQVKSDKVRP